MPQHQQISENSLCFCQQEASKELVRLVKEAVPGGVGPGTIHNRAPFLNRGLAFQSAAWQVGAGRRCSGASPAQNEESCTSIAGSACCMAEQQCPCC